MRTAQIVSVKRNMIRKISVKKRYSLFLSLCAMSIVVIVTIFSLGGTNIKQLSNYMSYVFDPVNSLYNDNSSVVFTSSMVSKDKLNFVLPIVGANSTIDELGNIQLKVNDSIMVKAIEGGIVEEVGVSNDGIKYIRILHTVNICSVIENLDVVGVKDGQVIKIGQDIATAKLGSIVTLRLFENNTQITDIKLNQSKIIWQN
jgi:hypothetical protein